MNNGVLWMVHPPRQAPSGKQNQKGSRAGSASLQDSLRDHSLGFPEAMEMADIQLNQTDTPLA